MPIDHGGLPDQEPKTAGFIGATGLYEILCGSTSGSARTCARMPPMTKRLLIFLAVLTAILALLPGAATAQTNFEDVPSDHIFSTEIRWLAERGTTLGCNPPANNLFCPDETVTRGQMAAFLSRTLGLTQSGDRTFIDDDESVFEADIERIASADITVGCNPPVNNRFCPGKPVTRGQMAAFLVRGLNLTARSGERFVDDDGSIFEADIERLATAGITTGCNPPVNDRFCPDQVVSRGQMAAFLYRALNPGAASPADALAPSRRIAWEPGVPNGIPTAPIAVSVTDFGATGNGSTDDAGAFQQAIDSLPGSGGVVYAGAGLYKLRSTLRLRDGVVLRGAGSDATYLDFDLGGASASAIEIVGWDYGSWRGVSGGFQKGSNKLTLSDTSGITAPMFAEIQQTNDADVMYTKPEWNVSWADNSVGEMVRIVAVSGNTVTLESPLNISYQAGLNPILRTHDLVERAGLERLNIRRLDNGNGDTIRINHAAYPWIREVESQTTGRSHVSMSASYRCEIRDSYFHDAQNISEPGRGYGVSLDLHVTDCLVENNVFKALRHSMMVQLGANGNVFGYNYSLDSVFPYGVPEDISIHGHYPFMNLFEGNVVDKIGVGDWWGPAGPGNTMVRNCVKTEGLAVSDHSHTTNLLGNVLVGSPSTTQIDWSVQNSLVHGNYEAGSVRWDPSVTIQSIRSSYYLSSAPNFYGGAAWPSIGPEFATSCTNPAQQRFASGNPVP